MAPSKSSTLILSNKTKYKNGTIYLTSHRIVFLSKDANISIPLFYLAFKDPKSINFILINTQLRPSYEIELYTAIYKTDLPPLPHYPAQFSLSTGKNCTKDQFLKKTMELLQLRYWDKPIIPKIEEKKVIEKMGIAGIKK